MEYLKSCEISTLPAVRRSDDQKEPDSDEFASPHVQQDDSFSGRE